MVPIAAWETTQAPAVNSSTLILVGVRGQGAASAEAQTPNECRRARSSSSCPLLVGRVGGEGQGWEKPSASAPPTSRPGQPRIKPSAQSLCLTQRPNIRTATTRSSKTPLPPPQGFHRPLPSNARILQNSYVGYRKEGFRVGNKIHPIPGPPLVRLKHACLDKGNDIRY